MTAFEITLLIITAVLALAAAVFALLYAAQKRNMIRLAQSIDKFIENGAPTDFSTRDNSLARLQNSVSELESRLLLEKSNTASQARSNADFIADISHQLKTPLAGMRLYCEMAHGENPTAYTKKELLLIEKMEKLILNLLRLEKIRGDSYVMDFKTHDIKALAEKIIAEFVPLFPQKHYSVTGVGEMRCDGQWLSEAVGNVVKNASEHTAPDGKVGIEVEQSEKTLTVTVTDDGGGVLPNELPKLFMRFHRTSSAAPNSTGIGLAITKAIIEKHHGTVSAENTCKGLRVTMCFPLIDGNLKI